LYKGDGKVSGIKREVEREEAAPKWCSLAKSVVLLSRLVSDYAKKPTYKQRN